MDDEDLLLLFGLFETVLGVMAGSVVVTLLVFRLVSIKRGGGKGGTGSATRMSLKLWLLFFCDGLGSIFSSDVNCVSSASLVSLSIVLVFGVVSSLCDASDFSLVMHTKPP